jgi:hypothetical protein
MVYRTAPPPPETTVPPPAEIAPQPAASPEEPLAPAAESPEGTPVFFANPFDATEIFEFPPGTSETEARDAVANALLKRARERANLPPGSKERRLARRG